jgi:WD40 repeat protein/tetratricopeptide (TPR) repeat protein
MEELSMRAFAIAALILSIPVSTVLGLDEFGVTEIKTLDTFNDYVREVRFSPFGTYFAVTVGDNTVHLYDRAFNRLWTSQGDRKSVGGKLSFSPDEKHLAFTRYKSTGDIGIFSLAEMRVIQALDGHPEYVSGVSYSPDGRYLVSCGSEKRVILWEWKGDEFVLKQEATVHEKPIRDIAFSPDGRFVASAGDDAKIIIWKLFDGELRPHQELSNNKYYVSSVAFSPDGSVLASGSTNLLTFWKLDGEGFVEEQKIGHHAGGMWSVEFSPDGRYLAAALSNGTVKVWVNDGTAWKETHNVYRHNDNVFDASFRSDGRLFASGSSDQTAVFWRLEGVGPNPVIGLLNALTLPFTDAQKLVVNPRSSRSIMSSIENDLTAPRDEFETSEEYERRMQLLSSHVLLRLQELTEAYFNVERKKRGIIGAKIDGLEAYNADEQRYTLRVFGTEARLAISPAEARLLKKNQTRALVYCVKRVSSDGVSYVYDKFELEHPVSKKRYTLSLQENPFRGSYPDESGTLKVGELGLAGVTGPSLAIDEVSFEAVFPVFYRYYDEQPIGSAVLHNNGNTAVDNIQVRLFIKQYMDNPKICRAPTRLARGEKSDVTLYGLFTNRMLEISEGNKVSVKIIVDYTAGGKPSSQEFVGSIRIYNRNAITWDDDRKVAAFVTAKDTAVLKFSKNVAGMIKGRTSDALNTNLLLGIAIHETLRIYGMNYVIDPTTPHREYSRNTRAVDFLQFPVQTLEYRAGDCDDLSILYNALLESVGIETAFITVPGHILTAFSLDMTADEAKGYFDNEADLIFVDRRAWIPVETTLLEEGFLKAWLIGAKQWRDNASRNNASFFATRNAWRMYEPVGFFGSSSLTLPESSRVVKKYLDEVDRLIKHEIAAREEKLLSDIERSGDDPDTVNRLGVLYARYGMEDRAIEQFDRALRQNDYTPALMNMGNVYYLRRNYEKALTYYERAYQQQPENARVLLGLTRVYQKLGDDKAAEKTYSRLKRKDKALARQHDYLESASADGSRASRPGSEGKILWEE